MVREGADFTPHTTRIHGIVASQRRVAVLLRRGPSKAVRLIHWRLEDDAFEFGQWLSGRVYPERCALSPSGQLFLYFAGKFKGELPTFTAISRPPYFTALALWSEAGTWGGGGYFLSDNDIVVHSAASMAPRIGDVPTGVKIRNWETAPKRHPNDRHGWTSIDPRTCKKASPLDPEVHLERETRFPNQKANNPLWECDYVIVTQGGRRDLGVLDWVDWDLNGDLLISHAGKVFRWTRASDYEDSRELGDFSDQNFENIPPQENARRWP